MFVRSFHGICDRKAVTNSRQAAPASRGIGGFTLIELMVVMMVLGLVYALVLPRLPNVRYWREEAMLRKLSETITSLHFQAVNDGVFYRMEFDLRGDLDKCRKTPCYRVGQIVAEQEDTSILEKETTTAGNSAGLLSLELAAFLNPSTGEYQNMIVPENFPSLAEPVQLEPETFIAEIKTMRGMQTADDSDRPYIMFSPRGFSEFAVIHLQMSNEDNKVTLLVNPFTGLTEIYRGPKFKDFEWTYSGGQNAK